MNHPDPSRGGDAIRAAAARWTVLRDRGLSAREAVEFELWLAADPGHARAMARAGSAWSRLEAIPEAVVGQVLQEARRRRWNRWLAAGLAASAIAAGLAWFGLGPVARLGPVPEPASLHAAGPRQVTLADGSEVRLNAGGEIREEFTAGERRVVLSRGEAHFAVTKDASRPFVVLAGNLRVRAVGTAFNVHRDERRIQVLVTEGRVGLEREAPVQPAEVGAGVPGGAGPIVHLSAGEQAEVVTVPDVGRGRVPPVVVTQVTPTQITRALAWQEQFVRLGGATLGEITADFERRTGHAVLIADPELAALRLGGRFRADDVEGFARLLPTMLEVSVERGPGDTLVLRSKKNEAR